MTMTYFLVLMLLFLAVSICYFGIKATFQIVEKNNKDTYIIAFIFVTFRYFNYATTIFYLCQVSI